MIIENPFVFGRAAEGSYFTDRTEDAKRLSANLTHGINDVPQKDSDRGMDTIYLQ